MVPIHQLGRTETVHKFRLAPVIEKTAGIIEQTIGFRPYDTDFTPTPATSIRHPPSSILHPRLRLCGAASPPQHSSRSTRASGVGSPWSIPRDMLGSKYDRPRTAKEWWSRSPTWSYSPCGHSLPRPEALTESQTAIEPGPPGQECRVLAETGGIERRVRRAPKAAKRGTTASLDAGLKARSTRTQRLWHCSSRPGAHRSVFCLGGLIVNDQELTPRLSTILVVVHVLS